MSLQMLEGRVLMGLVDIQDELLQGITSIAYKENVPVEKLIGTVIQDYTRSWEDRKAKQESIKGRKYKRQETDWDDNFQFQFCEGFANKAFPGKLKDISINGISFAFADQQSAQKDPLFWKKTLIVSFESPEDNRTIRFRMVPRHIRQEGDENIVGLAFADDDCDYHDFVSFLQLVEHQTKKLAQEAENAKHPVSANEIREALAAQV